MPESEMHMAQYKHNKDFFDIVHDKVEYVDWSITVLFYCAVQLVDMELSNYEKILISKLEIGKGYNPHPNTHKERKDMMLYSPILKRIFTTYKLLEAESRKSRYACFQYNDPISALDENQGYLKTIEDAVFHKEQ